ncbi:SDR family NAD(P)-dependent oxidoreductase [Natranaeroarchaeum sulfidigenes]|uniref:Short-chain alcohol dehydrogenase n=1 Tax=Natranaeroarchaeum sulfidigenes TaxID=2784880 RepID=A0A897MZ80_9EURY|nr:SDR family NAD(P)-dependent oxidoreductase [Natranaeroarchaeum sulfidigenes]QSG03426.1 Short-chain alcohol dehydrogenase [Natranaeroarchaeum sulfidigenes]
MFDFENRVVMVTGGGQGIGAATATLFGEQGANVVVTDVVEEREAVGEAVEDAGGSALVRELDVTDYEQAQSVVKDTVDEFGRVDVLVNNAGIFPTAGVDEMTPEDWQRVIDINLTGTFNCTKAVLPVMRDQEYGRIVNISSASGGKIGWSGELSHYAASKGGVVGFTRSAAIDLGPDGITMNAIVPGMIDTGAAEEVSTDEEIQGAVNMTPVGRQGDPDELAAAIVYLASEPAAFVTGESLVVDGGITLV